jgi:hypothetical protein
MTIKNSKVGIMAEKGWEFREQATNRSFYRAVYGLI